MKKNIIILFSIILLTQFVHAGDVSNNAFNIMIKNNIPIIDNSNNSNSNGAIGIALGSIFGGLVLGGIVNHYYKKGIILSGCHVKSKLNALIPMCFNKKVAKKYKKDVDFYLNKIFLNEDLDNTCRKKYILIPDTFVNNKTYNRIYFKVDKNYSKIRLIQYSMPYDLKDNFPNLDSRIYKDNNIEIPTTTQIMDYENGKLIKKGNYNFNPTDYYFLDTSLVGKQNNNTYAIVLEFEI